MATNQNLSLPDQADAPPVPSLDESLAQLEHALDLFASTHEDEQFGETHIIAQTPASVAPTVQAAEPAAAGTAPSKDELFEQTIKELKQKIAQPQAEGGPQWTGVELFRVPVDDEAVMPRRFPFFTDSQKKLILLIVIFLAFFALIGFLIWQRQKTDEQRLATDKQEAAQFRSLASSPASLTPPAASPVVDIPSVEQELSHNIKQILQAYNPSAASARYKVEVKDGVVTLSGEAQSQMEKDGVESVIKPLTGIKKVVNNLTVKGLLLGGGAGGMTAPNGPVMYPQVNQAEAKRLEDSLKRDLTEGAKRAEEERLRIEQQSAQLVTQRTADETAKQEAAKQEAERLRRQQTATLHNEEDTAFRKQAEERLKQREKEEAERRAEEQRKAEAERKTESTRQETKSLRVGTVTWQGLVKGVDDVVLRNASATIQHVVGDPLHNAKGVFSSALPDAPMSVRLVAASGPAQIRIIQHPSSSNNFTTIVRVGDGNKANGKLHSFTLRWSSQ